MNRKHLLVALMAVVIAGNRVFAAAQDVKLLIVTRLITAVAHAVIASVAAALAISLVDESKQARAISAVFGGLTASLAVGVPLCTCIGQHLGWRAAFLAVAVISALALVGDLLFLPSGPGSPGVPLRRQVARLADKQLGPALVVALLGFGGQILAYTYVTPSLEDVSGFSPRTISLLLLGFGAAAAAGNFIAGPIADRWLGPALLGGLALLAATLSAMTITGQTRSGAVITLLVWGGGRVRHRADLPELPLPQRSRHPPRPPARWPRAPSTSASRPVPQSAGRSWPPTASTTSPGSAAWSSQPRWPSSPRRCTPAHTSPHARGPIRSNI